MPSSRYEHLRKQSQIFALFKESIIYIHFLTENKILEPDWNGKNWKSFVQNNSVFGFNFLVNSNKSVLKVDTQQQ